MYWILRTTKELIITVYLSALVDVFRLLVQAVPQWLTVIRNWSCAGWKMCLNEQQEMTICSHFKCLHRCYCSQESFGDIFSYFKCIVWQKRLTMSKHIICSATQHLSVTPLTVLSFSAAGDSQQQSAYCYSAELRLKHMYLRCFGKNNTS